MKIVTPFLLWLFLASFAPAPVPIAVYTARLAVVTSAKATQECTFETASAKLSAQIADPLGIPYGFVQAWSCSGDGIAVANELQQRVSDMQAQAAAYRQAHPITR